MMDRDDDSTSGEALPGPYRSSSRGSGPSQGRGAMGAGSSGPLQINTAGADTGWYPFLEDMLAAAAEEAQGYRAMHEKAHKHYSKISSRLMIPAIILSTLTGVANFGQPSLEEIIGSRAPLYIGIVSIIAAIFSTIAKYLRADEKSELHRTAMISWDKLHRLLSTVLTQPRRNRVDAQEFLMQYREERNRLTEQVPVIPYKIRTWFIDTYGRLYKNAQIQKPSILVLSDVTVYRSETSQPNPNAGSSLTVPNDSIMPQVPRADRLGRLAFVRERFASMLDAIRGRGPHNRAITLSSTSPKRSEVAVRPAPRDGDGLPSPRSPVSPRAPSLHSEHQRAPSLRSEHRLAPMPKFPQELDDALRPPPPSFFGLKPPAPGKPHLARKDIAVPELEYSDEEELKPEAPRMLKMLAAARSNGLRNARPLQEPPPAAALAVSAQSPHSIAANFAGSLLSGAATSASSAMVVAAAAASDQLEQAAAALEAPSLPSEITEVGARSAADELPSLAEAEEPNEPNEPNEPTPDEPYRDEA